MFQASEKAMRELQELAASRMTKGELIEYISMTDNLRAGETDIAIPKYYLDSLTKCAKGGNLGGFSLSYMFCTYYPRRGNDLVYPLTIAGTELQKYMESFK